MKTTITLLIALLPATLTALHAAGMDPGEATNVFTQEPDKAKELFAVLKADVARGRSRESPTYFRSKKL